MFLRPLRRRRDKAPALLLQKVRGFLCGVAQVTWGKLAVSVKRKRNMKRYGASRFLFLSPRTNTGHTTWLLHLITYPSLFLSFSAQSHLSLFALYRHPFPVWLHSPALVPYSLFWGLFARFQILVVVGIWGFVFFPILISLYAVSSISDYSSKYLWIFINYSLRWCIGSHRKKPHAEFTAWSYEGKSQCLHDGSYKKCCWNAYCVLGTG